MRKKNGSGLSDITKRCCNFAGIVLKIIKQL